MTLLELENKLKELRNSNQVTDETEVAFRYSTRSDEGYPSSGESIISNITVGETKFIDDEFGLSDLEVDTKYIILT